MSSQGKCECFDVRWNRLLQNGAAKTGYLTGARLRFESSMCGGTLCLENRSICRFEPAGSDAVASDEGHSSGQITLDRTAHGYAQRALTETHSMRTLLKRGH